MGRGAAQRGRTQKERIVKRLGYLPLAVKLAGAQLQRKPASEWLAALDLRKLATSRPEAIHDSLEITFGRSIDELDVGTQRLYVALAIFPEDEAIYDAEILHISGRSSTA
jgi:hypothetical protein